MQHRPGEHHVELCIRKWQPLGKFLGDLYWQTAGCCQATNCLGANQSAGIWLQSRHSKALFGERITRDTATCADVQRQTRRWRQQQSNGLPLFTAPVAVCRGRQGIVVIGGQHQFLLLGLLAQPLDGLLPAAEVS